MDHPTSLLGVANSHCGVSGGEASGRASPTNGSTGEGVGEEAWHRLLPEV